jgi:hypothetical protein
MIRPVLYVDLPGIIYALDRRVRSLGRPLASFICAPDYEEMHSGLMAMLANAIPIHPMIRTWICEEHWHLFGVAQTRARPNTSSWDIQYLASLTQPDVNSADVIVALLEYVLNAALTHGMQRVFARTSEDPDILPLFQRVGFQCYTREMLYVRTMPIVPESIPSERIDERMSEIRRWVRLDTWGLARLHDATTPRRVQVAETLGNTELAYHFVPRQRFWSIPGVAPCDESYVIDLGSRLGAWVRVRQGWAGLPHQIWIKIHPESSEFAERVIRFALKRISQFDHGRSRPPYIICHVRDYEGVVIDALRQERFEHVDTKAILVRHLGLHAFTERAVHSIEKARVNYGVKGLGTIQSVPIEDYEGSIPCRT